MTGSADGWPGGAREHFLSLVSHELRTPLNGIKSWAHVLERHLSGKPPDEMAEKAVAGILMGVEQQVALIEELVDAARVLGGSVELSRQPMRLEAALADAIAATALAAQDKGVEVVKSSPVASVLVHGDFARLQQVLARLLDNAIRFSPPSSRVRIDRGTDDLRTWIAIADEGPAIPPAALALLFEPPARGADPCRGRRAHMLGVGLAVSKRIAELHGGSLDCASESARPGATFRLTLPKLREPVTA